MNMILEECFEKAADYRCTRIVNEYINFYNSNIEDYELHHLDCIYYYLMHAHKTKSIDIYNYNYTLYFELFLII